MKYYDFIVNNRYYYSVTMFARVVSCAATFFWCAVALLAAYGDRPHEISPKAYVFFGGVVPYACTLLILSGIYGIRIVRESPPSPIGLILSVVCVYHWAVTAVAFCFFVIPLSPTASVGSVSILVLSVISFASKPVAHLTSRDQEKIAERITQVMKDGEK